MNLLRIALMLFVFPVVSQATSQAPIDLIRALTEQVLTQLDANPEIRMDSGKLIGLVEESVAPSIDFNKLSRLAVGKYWRKVEEDQKKEFTGEFKQLLIRTYATAMAEYSGEDISYHASGTKAGGKRAVIRVTVGRSGGGSIDIHYNLYQTTSGWKIYDMKVEGISLVVNYRSSFKREIRANGMDGLIKHLAALNH